MNRQEIIAMLRNPETICCDECSERFFMTCADATTQELIEVIRAATCVIAFRITGDLNNTMQSKEQWVAAMQEVVQAHMDSIKDPSQWETLKDV